MLTASLRGTGMRICYNRDEMVELTGTWDGERDGGGRPLVPNEVLAELAKATNEQAWNVLAREDHERSFVGGWRQTRPGGVLVGRAVTAQFLPQR